MNYNLCITSTRVTIVTLGNKCQCKCPFTSAPFTVTAVLLLEHVRQYVFWFTLLRYSDNTDSIGSIRDTDGTAGQGASGESTCGDDAGGNSVGGDGTAADTAGWHVSDGNNIQSVVFQV